MTDQPMTTPTITADQLGITPITLRRWCTYHAAHLSTGANPPVGQARRFNGRDIEVLKHVKLLRDQGFSVANINDQLGQLTFAEIDTEDHTADESEELAPINASGSPQTAPLAMIAPEYLMAIERRFDALEAARQEDKRERLDRLTMLGIGLCMGLLLSLVIFVVGWLYMAG